MKKIILLLIFAVLSLPLSAQRRDLPEKEEKAKTAEYKPIKIKGLYVIKIDTYTKTALYARGGSVSDDWFDLWMQWTDGMPPKLYARIGYRGADWCFFTKALFKYTASDILCEKTLTFSRQDRRTKVSSSQYTGVNCIEYVDVFIDDELFKYFYDMTASSDAIMRVEGDSYKNNELNSKWLGGLRKTMDIYKELTANFKSAQVSSQVD